MKAYVVIFLVLMLASLAGRGFFQPMGWSEGGF
jgi:hypothetical protein